MVVIAGLLSWVFLLGFKMNSSNNGKIVIVTKADNGKELSLVSGDTLELQLETAGATGYDWYSDSLNAAHLQLISEKTQDQGKSGMVGAPVVKTWKFKLLKPGKTSLSLDYYRVWEGKNSAIDHFAVGLSIK